jgi:hypothetical protein
MTVHELQKHLSHNTFPTIMDYFGHSEQLVNALSKSTDFQLENARVDLLNLNLTMNQARYLQANLGNLEFCRSRFSSDSASSSFWLSILADTVQRYIIVYKLEYIGTHCGGCI